MVHFDPGKEIYKKSNLIIDSLLKKDSYFDNSYSEKEKIVVKRVVHATSDTAYASSMFFVNNPVDNASVAINKSIEEKKPLKIVCDSEMTRAGISENVNKDVLLELYCYIRLEEKELREKFYSARNKYPFLDKGHYGEKVTRSAMSIRLAILENMPDFIVVGNAPTALDEVLILCNDFFEATGYKPYVIIGMPVGFVGASESKQSLHEDVFSSIGNFGNMGGSSSAASAVNALLSIS